MSDHPPPVEVLDFRILAEYEEMSPGLAAELSSMFLDDVPGRLEALRAALRTGDLQTVAKLSHTLKGTSSTSAPAISLPSAASCRSRPSAVRPQPQQRPSRASSRRGNT